MLGVQAEFDRTSNYFCDLDRENDASVCFSLSAVLSSINFGGKYVFSDCL